MQIELAGVGGGEEILAEPGNQQKGGGAERRETPERTTPRRRMQVSSMPQITHAHRFEAAFESALETRRECSRLRLGGVDAACGFSRYIASVGTSVREST